MSPAARRDLRRFVHPLDAEFHRHVPLERARAALAASDRGGRWAPRGIRVLDVGRPVQSVVAEAYKMLGEPGDAGAARIPPENFLPRECLTIAVALDAVVDLTGSAYTQLGLEKSDLSGKFTRCQAVGEKIALAGHEALLVPAATGLGETLAIYADNLQAGSSLDLVARNVWRSLPPDPRDGAIQEPGQSDEPYISAEQIAWRLGNVDKSIVAEWRKLGLPALRLSERKYVYRFSEVERWLRDREWDRR